MEIDDKASRIAVCWAKKGETASIFFLRSLMKTRRSIENFLIQLLGRLTWNSNYGNDAFHKLEHILNHNCHNWVQQDL